MNKQYLLVIFLISFQYISAQNNEIEWMSFEEAVEKNNSEPRKIIVDIYTTWCGWCKKMDATTFQDPTIVKYIKKNYWAVKLDAERKDTVRLGQQVFINENPTGRRSAHQLAIALLNGKMSYPSIVYLDENIDMLQPIAGYQDAKSIEPILKYFGEDAYKTVSWSDFEESFNSSK
jgi:thioredoxin-related protein